jgi:hypothetical protein
MKNIFTILIILVFSVKSLAQSSCTKAMSSFDFETKKRIIQSQTTDANKFRFAKELIETNCLVTLQVKEISGVFQDDMTRLEFAKTAYQITIDKNNFYDVYNTFAYFSTVFMLHDYVVSQRVNATSINPSPVNPNPKNPNNLPNNACKVSELEMTDIKKAIDKESFNNTKITIAKNLIRTKKCFTVSQIREVLQLISFEESKLEIAKYAYDFTTDKEKYMTIVDDFSFFSSKDSFTAFVQSK